MRELMIDVNELPESMIGLFDAEKVVVKQSSNGDIVLTPVEKLTSEEQREVYRRAIEKACGMWADRPEMSVDKFLERMREDKELEDRLWEEGRKRAENG